VALLENPIGTTAENYLTNGNRLLLDLFNTQIEMCDALTDPNAQLQELATRIEAQGFRPYVIPVGGSNALGAMGYVESALEIAQQCEGPFRSLPWWSRRAVRERMPGWRWGWNN
jgi:D-cysteine desulfhydrase